MEDDHLETGETKAGGASVASLKPPILVLEHL